MSGINNNQLAGAMQDLANGNTDLWLRNHPLYHYIMEMGNVNRHKLEGLFYEFTVQFGGPGKLQSLSNGNTQLESPQNDMATKGRAFLGHVTYNFGVDQLDMQTAGGKYDINRILQNGPEAALKDMQQAMGRQLSVGAEAGAEALTTLYGRKTYSPRGEVTNGLLEFAPKASQTATIHNIVSEGGANGIEGWFNQYAETASAVAEIRRTTRDLVDACNDETLSMEEGVQLLFGDPASYSAYLESLDIQVRNTAPTTRGGDRAPEKVRKGVEVSTGILYRDSTIKLSSVDAAPATGASFAPNTGIIYVLTPSDFTLVLPQGNKLLKGETKSELFKVMPPRQSPDSLMVNYTLLTSLALVCHQRRTQGVIVGGAT